MEFYSSMLKHLKTKEMQKYSKLTVFIIGMLGFSQLLSL